MSRRRESFRGCLVGVLVGDRFGARFGDGKYATIRHRYPTDAEMMAVKLGSYTGATEMTAALAESLVRHPEFEGEDAAAALLQARTEGRFYSADTAYSLGQLREGVHWTEAAQRPAGSGGVDNGAALRSAPVGLLGTGDVEHLRWVAEEAAALTHQHALGSEAAVLLSMGVALACASSGQPLAPDAFLERIARESQVPELSSRVQAAAWLVVRPVEPARVVDRLGNNPSGLGSVATALYAFAAHQEEFADAVLFAASLGGNASGIAAMTGALAGAYHGFSGIPEAWRAAPDDGEITVDSMIDVADRLYDAFSAG